MRRTKGGMALIIRPAARHRATTISTPCPGYLTNPQRNRFRHGDGTRGPLSEAGLDRGKTWSQSTPMRSYASPTLYGQREALHRSGTDCPSGVRPPRQQSRIALRGQFVIVTFSPIAGAGALNMAGPQWVYVISHG